MDVLRRRRFVSANTQITGKEEWGDGEKVAAFSVTQSPADVGGRVEVLVAETDRQRKRRRRVMGQ